jgi:gluconokinase
MDGKEQPRCVILALDIGSSSLRCTAYHCAAITATSDETGTNSDQYNVLASSSYKRKSIEPLTGRILVDGVDSNNLFDEIDQCVDDVVHQLSDDTMVMAIGFSTLVMNLIGVDCHGVPIGNDATMSYACQTTAVNEEVEQLKRYVQSGS